MMDIAWVVAFVLMCAFLGGSAVGCVALAERGKTNRLRESEQTRRIGMDNAWQLEQSRLQSNALGSGSGFTFELPGGDDDGGR